MKKLALLGIVFCATSLFGENFVLENQTPYPSRKQQSKIAIQWASSAREVQERNESIIRGAPQDPTSLAYLKNERRTSVTTPSNAQYFRILVWSKEEKEPDLATNWIDIEPNKTYVLKTDHLTPIVLMTGMGC